MTTSIFNKAIKKIVEFYVLGNIVKIEPFRGGIINQTYYVKNDAGEEFTVQMLHAMFKEHLMQDIYAITQHLSSKQWDCLKLLKSKENSQFCKIDNNIWRVYGYIKGESFLNTYIQEDLYQNIGYLLGLLHKNLGSFNYKPKHILNGFHNKSFYVKKAMSIGKKRYLKKLQDIFDDVLAGIEKNATTLSTKPQLIHGDPRVENILFTDKHKPFMFIDYDTFMMGSVFLDIGDCLRSLLSLPDSKDNKKRIEDFLIGYNSVGFDENIPYDAAVSALKYITLELCLRFIIDSVENSYFSWDNTQYATQKMHNESRALETWNIFYSFNQSL